MLTFLTFSLCAIVVFIALFFAYTAHKAWRRNREVICLYGTDYNGIPCVMFFSELSHARDFTAVCPGKYDYMPLRGIGYNDFTVPSDSL